MSKIGIVLSVLFLAGPTAATSNQQGQTVTRSAGGSAKQAKVANFAKGSVSRSKASSLTNLKSYPEQNQRSSRNWSPALTDIARHLPAGAEYDGAYRRFTEDYDLVTAGHEWTHYLNAYLCRYETTAYYLMGDKFITLAVPKKLRGIVPAVPASLRGDLYQLYFVEHGLVSARFDPLYLFNEWTAYANDVTVAIDQLALGKPLNPFMPDATQPKTAGNVLEFTFYGCAVGMAVKKHDPQYYASEAGQKLREFITFNTLRSLDVYRKALRRVELNQDDARNPRLLGEFRRSADTAEMRAWIKADLDKDVANALLGEEGTAGTADSGAARQALN